SAVARGLRSLAQLARGARQFAAAQARFGRQAGFAVRTFDQRLGARLDRVGVALQEAGDGFGRQARHLRGGGVAGLEHGVDVVPARDRIGVFGDRLAGGRVVGVEAPFGRPGLAPGAIDQYRLQFGGGGHDTGFSRISPSMSMRTTSPELRVKSSPGTMPVPVNRNAPEGWRSSRSSQPASSA